LRQINRRGLECLIKVGALDDFGERARILAAIDHLMQASSSAHDAADAGQLTLFGEVEVASDADILAVAGPTVKISNKDLLEWEKELVGVYVSSHPLQQMTVDLANVITHATVDITEELGRQAVVVAGLLAEVRSFTTKKGDAMAFCRLEDLQGSVDVTVFPQLFRERRELWKQDKIVIVWGKVDSRNGRISIVAERVQDYVQGQRIIEDTSTVYHRFQNGGAQVVRPEVRSGAGGNSLPVIGESRFAPPVFDRVSDTEDDDTGEANPFAAEAPDWLTEAAEPDWAERVTTPTAAIPQQPKGAISAPEAAVPAPVPAKEQSPAEPARPVAISGFPARSSARRLHVTMRRSHSLEADRRRLSDLVDLLEKYKGTDRFVIVIESPGEASYQLDFPNSYTCICKELRAELSQRLGVNHWRVE